MRQETGLSGHAIAWLALAALILSPILFVAYFLIQFTLGLIHGGKQALKEHNNQTEENDNEKRDDQ